MNDEKIIINPHTNTAGGGDTAEVMVLYNYIQL